MPKIKTCILILNAVCKFLCLALIQINVFFSVKIKFTLYKYKCSIFVIKFTNQTTISMLQGGSMNIKKGYPFSFQR